MKVSIVLLNENQIAYDGREIPISLPIVPIPGDRIMLDQIDNGQILHYMDKAKTSTFKVLSRYLSPKDDGQHDSVLLFLIPHTGLH